MSSCPAGKIINPKTGRCVSITGKLGREILAQSQKTPTVTVSTATPVAKKTGAAKGSGCVQFTASNTTPSQWKKYSTRASPPFPANECPESMIQMGNDGNEYVVSAPNAKGTKRWVKATTYFKMSPASYKQFRPTPVPQPAAKKASPKPAAKAAASGSCVQYTQTNTTASQYKKYSTRASPPYPANECPQGMVQKGNDGKDYVVSAPNAKGIKRWQKAK